MLLVDFALKLLPVGTPLDRQEAAAVVPVPRQRPLRSPWSGGGWQVVGRPL